MNYFVNEKDLDNIIIKELLYQTELEKYCTQLIEDAHLKALESIEVVFLKELTENNLLKEVEDLSDFYKILANKYQLFCSYFEEHSDALHHEKTKSLLQGIDQLFRQDLQGYLKEDNHQGSIENQGIINKGLGSLHKQFNLSKESCDKVILTEAIDEIYVASVLENIGTKLAKETVALSSVVMEQTFIELNQLDNRPVLQSYLAFLYKQDKTLATLNLMQLVEIRDEIAGQDELEIVGFLSELTESIYGLIGSKLKAVTAYLEQLVVGDIFTKENLERVYVDQFKEQALGSKSLKFAVDQYIENRDALLRSLYVNLTDELQRSKTLVLQELSKESKNVQLISSKVTEIIKNLNMNLLQVSKYIKESEDYAKIVFAIIDTIALKLEALKEKDYDYMLARKDKMLQREKQLFDFTNDFNTQFNDYFDKLVNESNKVFLKLQKDFTTLYDGFMADNRKEDRDYLKYNLLFEVVTLEDIANHSLPKLLVYNQTITNQVVNLIKNAYQEILSILKKFNILIIEVKPGEKFNGKLHEVTIVEPHNDYKKGEIIQMETRGYIYQNIPLVRAQVVVAK